MTEFERKVQRILHKLRDHNAKHDSPKFEVHRRCLPWSLCLVQNAALEKTVCFTEFLNLCIQILFQIFALLPKRISLRVTKSSKDKRQVLYSLANEVN